MRRPLMKFLLVVLTFIGIAGMFLYKFKYEQMKAIVEGAGLEAVDRYIHSYNLIPLDFSNTKNGAFESPAVSWVNISDYFVFSSFPCHRDSLEADSSTQDFCLMGFGPDTKPELDCSVWFDLGQDALSVPGKFSFTATKTDGTSSNSLYEFRCSVKDLRPIHRHPYVFSLKTADRKNKVIVPIFKPIRTSASNRFVLCVYPDYEGNDWKTIIEFFVFHDIAGFTDIIAYDIGINFGFLEKIKYLLRTSKGKLKSLSVIRWDFPSTDPTSFALIRRDCIYRTSGMTNFTALLNWNQFIVPHDQREIGASLTSSVPAVSPTSAYLPSKRCCTDAIDDRRSEKNWPVILKKTLCIPNKESNNIYISPGADLISSNMVEVNFADLITFAKCQGLALSDLVPVFSIWRYSSDIMTSSMLKKWMDSSLFSFSPS